MKKFFLLPLQLPLSAYAQTELPDTIKTQELDEFVLANAVTIHKSQGSEFPVVVIPITMKH